MARLTADDRAELVPDFGRLPVIGATLVGQALTRALGSTLERLEQLALASPAGR